MGWIDAFMNAAMLLGGMGPVDPLTNDAAKLFAGAYALYCGVVFIATAGLVLAPVGAHILHRFHLDQQDCQAGSGHRNFDLERLAAQPVGELHQVAARKRVAVGHPALAAVVDC